MKVSKCEMTHDAAKLAHNHKNAISYRKQTENTKGPTEGQKLLERS